VSDTETNLELVDTDLLITELRRRSAVFFLMSRPLANGPDDNWDWRVCWGVDGGAPNKPESLSRVLGLVELGKAHLLRPDRDEETE
jgi:hypothetical protein